MSYQTFKIGPHFMLSRLALDRKIELSDLELEQVDTLWQHRKARQKELFNGKLLSFVSFNGVQLVGECVDYKYFVAQEADPELKKLLMIEPICLTSITLSENSILIGRRSSSVFQHAGYFETVPSGGIAPPGRGSINIVQQVMRELKEETGITKSEQVVPFALIYDTELSLFEVCVATTISAKAAATLKPKTEEYEELRWASPAELSQLLKGEKWVPFSRFLLDYYQSTMTLPALPESMISKPFSKSSNLT